MQRAKLIRNQGAKRRPPRSPQTMEMQLVGQTAEHRKQATQRSSPSGSRVRMIRARARSGRNRL